MRTVNTTNIENWQKWQTDKLAMKVVVQAVKDFAFPRKIDVIRHKVNRLKTSDPDYKDMVEKLYLNARRKIIKDLKRPFMVAFSDGKSKEIAKKLQAILEDKTGVELKKIQRNVRSLDREEV